MTLLQSEFFIRVSLCPIMISSPIARVIMTLIRWWWKTESDENKTKFQFVDHNGYKFTYLSLQYESHASRPNRWYNDDRLLFSLELFNRSNFNISKTLSFQHFFDIDALKLKCGAVECNEQLIFVFLLVIIPVSCRAIWYRYPIVWFFSADSLAIVQRKTLRFPFPTGCTSCKKSDERILVFCILHYSFVTFSVTLKISEFF